MKPVAKDGSGWSRESKERAAERSAERMRKLNADPQLAARRMKKFNETILLRLLPDEG